MFYTIYKITNLLDGKIYIGKHQTKDLNDGYMGSGKHLKRAITKHGIENFKKEILFQFDNEADMNAKEAELVTEEFVKLATNYNICVGGQGGFSYINDQVWSRDKRLLHNARVSGFKTLDRTKYDFASYAKRANEIRSNLIRSGDLDPVGFSGRKHSDETRQKMSKSKNVGSSNSQFGTMWITNGQENKKIKKDVDIIPEGWYKGRKSN